MKKFNDQSYGSHVDRMNYGGGKVPKDRSVPIDVVHVVACAYQYDGADRLRQHSNLHSLSR